MLHAREKLDERFAVDKEENARRLLTRISEELFALIELSERMEIIDDRLKFLPMDSEMLVETDQCERFEIGLRWKRFLLAFYRRQSTGCERTFLLTDGRSDRNTRTTTHDDLRASS
jgi:hypothetical protein